jgi:hypothetical protein
MTLLETQTDIIGRSSPALAPTFSAINFCPRVRVTECTQDLRITLLLLLFADSFSQMDRKSVPYSIVMYGTKKCSIVMHGTKKCSIVMYGPNSEIVFHSPVWTETV